MVGAGLSAFGASRLARRLTVPLDNLLDNALRYAPPASTIVVQVRKDASTGTVSVCDSGPGIGEKDREHIFDRFYRADSSRARHSGGIGLGLIAARAFAEAHGGQIEVKSRPGDEAAFTLRFPNAPEDTVMQEPWPTAAGAGHAQLPRP